MRVVKSTVLICKKGKIIKNWDNVRVKDHSDIVLNTLKTINN